MYTTRILICNSKHLKYHDIESQKRKKKKQKYRIISILYQIISKYQSFSKRSHWIQIFLLRQLINGPRFHEIAIQLQRSSIVNGGAVTRTCAPPQFTRETTRHLYVQTRVHNVGSTRGEAWKMERLDICLQTSRIWRYFPYFRLVKVVSATLNRLCLWCIDNQFIVLIEFFRPRRRRNKFRFEFSMEARRV